MKVLHSEWRRDEISGKSYVNKMALIGHTSINAVLMLAYLAELLKGQRTIGYTAMIEALIVLPVVAEHILYRMNKENRVIQHIIGITYSLFYIVAVFTTVSISAFVYVLPMYMVVILFADVPYCVILSSGAFLTNVVYVIYKAVSVGIAAEEMADVEIRLASMLLSGIFMVLSSMAIKRVNQEKLNRINEQQKKTNDMLEDVLATSDNMIQGIAAAAKNMEQLGESVFHIHSSMQEVSSGSNETAESVQIQLQRTEQIQQHITTVKDTAEEIDKSVVQTNAEVELGQKHMDELNVQVEKSMEANDKVVKQMQELTEYTEQMHSIIDAITSIAGRTGMLALNASIEAARAGEAGKGFAVVAGEITTLANQTKAATVNITELIESINRELSGVIAAIDVVTESNRSNAESTKQVEESFRRIVGDTYNIGRQTEDMMGAVTELERANADIVESIQTISAITEEVSAHASETYASCEDNTVMVDEVNKIVTDLNVNAEKLKQYQ